MLNVSGNNAIGVFDSGLGGLTVVREIIRLLPEEDVVYFGDVARLPYGNKSRETVIKFSVENSLFLLSRGIKLLVVACNTATALALEFLQSIFSIPVVGVVDPVVERVAKMSPNEVAVIGTVSTIRSGVYQSRLREFGVSRINAKACPLLVPTIEAGYVGRPICDEIIRDEISPVLGRNTDLLLLACTHYPIIKRRIKTLFPKVRIVDSALPTAKAVKKLLDDYGIRKKHGVGTLELFVSDMPNDFEAIARKFLGKDMDDVKVRKVGDVLY